MHEDLQDPIFVLNNNTNIDPARRTEFPNFVQMSIKRASLKSYVRGVRFSMPLDSKIMKLEMTKILYLVESSYMVTYY